MSWHYLQEQEGASWEGNSLDGALSALLKLIPGTGKCCLPDNVTGASTPSRCGMMSQPLMADRGVDLFAWSAEDSRAKTSAVQEAEKVSVENAADYGDTWRESWGKYDPNTCSWRTHQTSLLGGWEPFSETWPRWGMMQNGEFWGLDTPEPIMRVTGSGYWPTPQVSGRIQGKMKDKTIWKTCVQNGGQIHLTGQLRLMGVSPERFPSISDWVMGWPVGWSDSRPLETDKFQQWCRSHGIYCANSSC